MLKGLRKFSVQSIAYRLGFKRLDTLLLRSFLPPFLLIFCIVLFVLVMQFLWKYIDDLVGKGLEWYVISELLFYASASFVPVALPLAVLLSSIMAMGGLGENFELTSGKASGISLLRIMRPLIITSIILALCTLAFSNYLLPVANLKFGSLLYDIRQQRPALSIKEGVFYNGIDNYSIRIGSKDADNQTIYNVMIYDHSSGKGNDNVIVAKKGSMTMTEDKRYLVLKLFDGEQYQEMDGTTVKEKKMEQVRIKFAEWDKAFDLSGFNFTRTQEALFKENYQMLNISQLQKNMDTIQMEMDNDYSELCNYIEPYYAFTNTNLDSIINQKKILADTSAFTSLLNSDDAAKQQLIDRAVSKARTIKGFVNMNMRDEQVHEDLWVRHSIEWHRKFTLSVACIVLMLIGAPLGAIIRKGGLGLPFVVAIFFFVLFYALSITGEKSAKELALTPVFGMWLATMVLMPVAAWLTYKATIDSKLFNSDQYIKVITAVAKFFKRKHATEKI